MTNGLDFSRSVARFGFKDAGYIVDLLQCVYDIKTMDGSEDVVLAEFIAALDECDSIEMVSDEEGVLFED